MMLVMGLVVLAVILFVTEWLRVDVAALLISVLLGLVIFLPGRNGLLSPDLLFSGLSSDAVVSIIAVMIVGRGLDKTGVMEQIARMILRFGGRTESRVMLLVSSTAAAISSFMQNVGAAALFLPVVARISDTTGVAMKRLLMPMGFCAIAGGTLTMVGSSPLIMLNDLLANANQGQPGTFRSFDLFDVTPVGLALVASALLYFLFVGRFLLKGEPVDVVNRGAGTVRYLRRIHGVDAAVREVGVTVDSLFIGRDIGSLQDEYDVRIVASRYANKVLVSPPLHAPIAAPAALAVVAEREALRRFVAAGNLELRPKLKELRHLLARSIAGVAQLVLPPNSSVIGRSPREARLRMTYGLSLLSIVRAGEPIAHDLPDLTLQSGDTLICHTRWEHLVQLEEDRDFVVVTTNYPKDVRHPYKVVLALSFLLASLGLILFTQVALPIALMAGAVGMVVTNVLSIDDAYRAVSWKTVFLLVGLLPLGLAVENSGTANYLAEHMLATVGEQPVWVLQAFVALLATVFTLVMSNVGATVLLVPVAMNMAIAGGGDPTLFALTVAISTSNSFLLPTHQVNALIMGPGNYRVADFLLVGSIMTLVFLVVSLVTLNLVF